MRCSYMAHSRRRSITSVFTISDKQEISKSFYQGERGGEGEDQDQGRGKAGKIEERSIRITHTHTHTHALQTEAYGTDLTIHNKFGATSSVTKETIGTVLQEKLTHEVDLKEQVRMVCV